MRKKVLSQKTRRIKPGSKASPKETLAKTQRLISAKAKDTWGLHNLRPPQGSHRHKKLLGRGSSSGHGKTSCRGSKGQTSRAGRDFYLGFEGGQTPLIRKIPKRGFVSKFKKEYQLINLNSLSRIKEANINLKLLEEKGLIKDKDRLVKILGEGEIKEPITIQAHAFSKKAAEKIKNAGGKLEILHA